MSKINIITKNNYEEILIFDKNINNENNNYQNLLNVLKEKGIIKIEYNKLKILQDNICIIYNINDDDDEYKEIKQFKKFYLNKLEKHNIELILLNRYDNTIYYINNIIICHSKLIKELFSLEQFNTIFNNIMNNLKNNKLDISLITNEIIRRLILNIIINNKLTIKCFKNLDKDLIKYFTKDSEHLNKLSSVFYLDKTVIIENYKENYKRKLKLKNDDYKLIHITKNHIKLF